MDINSIRKFLVVVEKHSPNCFVNSNFEVIIVPKNNVYFRLEDVKSELELKCKVLAWLSRPSCKGLSHYWQKRVRAIFNEYLGTDFDRDDMEQIYTYLGLDTDRSKSVRFIKSNYNFAVLTA